MTPQLTSAEAKERIGLVRSAHREERGNFVRLVELARLDPARDLRFGNFSGVNFAGCDLEGYDFSGAVLHRCKFIGARIKHAKFSQCEYSFNPKQTRVRPGIVALDSNGKDIPIDTSKYCEYPIDADDSNEARRAIGGFGDTLSDNFDKHIDCGVYFRDSALSPLMKCIAVPKDCGKYEKYAFVTSDTEFVTCLAEWRSVFSVRENEQTEKLEFAARENERIEYLKFLNRSLGLGTYFSYKIISPHRQTVKFVPRDEFEHEFLFDDYTSTHLRLNTAAAKQLPLSAGRLIRRMRTTECNFPSDFEESLL